VTAYRAACAATGETAIDFVTFWRAIEAHFGADMRNPAAIVRDVVGEMHRRWARVLGDVAGKRSVTLAAAAVHDAARAAFAAPHPGWPSARHHSPDVLVAARDLAAPELYVLGEIHVGMNTLLQSVFVEQHPEPAQLLAHMAHDVAEPRIQPVIPHDHLTRVNDVSRVPRDFEVETGQAKSARPRAQVVAAGELVVEADAAGLGVRTRDRRLRFDVIAFLEYYLRIESSSHFTVRPPLAHAPRVTIDRLVISRERWTFTAEDLAFTKLGDPQARYLAARRFAAERGLPRRIFFKPSGEPKPCYLDLASPTYVELFCKLARVAPTVHVSELLPDVDDCWLTDASGARYASELRFVTVDPEPWRALPV
jgi:hypothetical protein